VATSQRVAASQGYRLTAVGDYFHLVDVATGRYIRYWELVDARQMLATLEAHPQYAEALSWIDPAADRRFSEFLSVAPAVGLLVVIVMVAVLFWVLVGHPGAR